MYEYERGSMEASERTARILINVFNEDVLSDVDLRPRMMRSLMRLGRGRRWLMRISRSYCHHLSCTHY
ncbi:hypothetical protein [Vulcanisaeta sp. JCM 16161]|uniref:hypothetical protein n=1 Tax=Vulcanisaeta sp. JCM 16161 TaxID=1295372 RepID=UPI000A8B8E3A|nr:hypothetical protein [Vulcanisaeta sp. JCM 16161]